MIYALGAFDGFHLGHQQLLEASRLRAEKSGTGWGVITFDGHPQMLFNKEGFKLLFTSEERDILVSYFDIPQIEKIPFTMSLADMLPEDFLAYIDRRNEIHGLVIGDNFRFGRARTGTPEMLAEMCSERKWSLDVVDPIMLKGIVVSSTAIREAVIRGQMEYVSEMLGYPFMVQGRVISGDRRGRSIGYPTANICVKSNKVYPARGCYSALSCIDGEWFCAAVNVGYNPTFEGTRGLRCEAHIIGYDGDLYDKNLTVFIVSRNREEMKFPGPEALSLQIGKDIKSSIESTNNYRKKNPEVLKKFEQLLL